MGFERIRVGRERKGRNMEERRETEEAKDWAESES